MAYISQEFGPKPLARHSQILSPAPYVCVCASVAVAYIANNMNPDQTAPKSEQSDQGHSLIPWKNLI